MRPHEFWGISLIEMRGCDGKYQFISQFIIEYEDGDSLELRGKNLSTAKATFGGRYARELF